MRKIVILSLLLSGCMMSSMNREGVAIIRDQAQKSQKGVVDALVATNELVEELQDAAKEGREADVATPIKKIATSLAVASEAIEETGKTATTLQEGMGQAKNPPPTTKEALEAWRRRYAVMKRMFDAALSWAKRTFPGVPIPSKQAPEPWSTTETTGLIGTIIAALGASGLGGKKLLDKRRRDRDEKEEAKASAAEAQSLAAALREKLDAEEFEDMMRENKCLKARLDKADYEKKANGNA